MASTTYLRVTGCRGGRLGAGGRRQLARGRQPGHARQAIRAGRSAGWLATEASPEARAPSSSAHAVGRGDDVKRRRQRRHVGAPAVLPHLDGQPCAGWRGMRDQRCEAVAAHGGRLAFCRGCRAHLAGVASRWPGRAGHARARTVGRRVALQQWQVGGQVGGGHARAQARQHQARQAAARRQVQAALGAVPRRVPLKVLGLRVRVRGWWHELGSGARVWWVGCQWMEPHGDPPHPLLCTGPSMRVRPAPPRKRKHCLCAAAAHQPGSQPCGLTSTMELSQTVDAKPSALNRCWCTVRCCCCGAAAAWPSPPGSDSGCRYGLSNRTLQQWVQDAQAVLRVSSGGTACGRGPASTPQARSLVGPVLPLPGPGPQPGVAAALRAAGRRGLGAAGGGGGGLGGAAASLALGRGLVRHGCCDCVSAIR